jgi:membrane associated rhomboid family serine protease
MGIYDREYYQADELRPLRPWDNKSMVTLLIIANVAIHIANFLFTRREGAIANLLSLRPDDIVNPLGWYRLVSYGFVHDPGSIFHLVFNMLTLYFLGRQVEEKYGKWEFLRIYLVSLFLCGLGWCLLRYMSGNTLAQLVGASGAVTTVAMLFVFSFPQATLMLYGVIPIKAWVLGVMLVVMNLLGGSQTVAYDVHLIGAVLAAVYFYGKLDLAFIERFIHSTKTSLSSKRRGLKVLRPDDAPELAPARDEQEADRILDKIHRMGKDSLTKREQAFLERYSRKVRKQRSSQD